MTAPRSLIEAENISLSVPVPRGKPLVIVNGVSLTIEAGMSYAVVGKSGSGKTSLLSVCGLLNTNYTGSLLVGGRDVAKMKDSDLSVLRARQIGFIFQSYSLVPHLSALDNVLLSCLYAKVKRPQAIVKARSALAEVGLGDRLDARPVQLSGGEQQRVAIARALVNHPQVVMADEPTGALDTDTGLAVMETLASRVREKNISLVVVTHDVDIARHCLRHYRMEHGKIYEDSSHLARRASAAPRNEW